MVIPYKRIIRAIFCDGSLGGVNNLFFDMGVEWTPVIWTTSAAMAAVRDTTVLDFANHPLCRWQVAPLWSTLSCSMVISTPIYHDESPRTLTTFMLQSQIVVGTLVASVSFCGWCCLKPSRTASMRIFMVMTTLLLVIELLLGGLLQGIQNDGACCGFGNRHACASPTSKWSREHPFLYRRCAVAPPSESYCTVVASGNETLAGDCDAAADWDFPFGGEGVGNVGRCLDENMRSGDGWDYLLLLIAGRTNWRRCYVAWLLYVQSQFYHLGIFWFGLAAIQASCVLSSWNYIQRQESSRHRLPEINKGPEYGSRGIVIENRITTEL
ncbi:hypothetical protein ACHHYP_20045 [Achlya hypogyna]|uniref:Transmembrane protein n=1 Tax=Achlya hypogyna TaxID=1202772 RepID=A0A1V9Z9Q6_ACHHY|nr:hypothetical protein ACHHYP_20045 [Achlya hypogyna]